MGIRRLYYNDNGDDDNDDQRGRPPPPTMTTTTTADGRWPTDHGPHIRTTGDGEGDRDDGDDDPTTLRPHDGNDDEGNNDDEDDLDKNKLRSHDNYMVAGLDVANDSDDGHHQDNGMGMASAIMDA